MQDRRRTPAPRVLAAVLVALAACAGTPAHARDKATADMTGATAPLFAKAQWTVASTSCPLGCADAMRDFLRAQTGRSVRLAGDRVEAPFLDACAGNVHWIASTDTLAELGDELAKAHPPAPRPFTAAELGVRDGAALRRAVAYCAADGADVPFARLLSIEPDRILILFEQQSVIELR
jgi:hypothetical protein